MAFGSRSESKRTKGVGGINGAADEFQRIEEDLHRGVLDFERYGTVWYILPFFFTSSIKESNSATCMVYTCPLLPMCASV